MERGYVTTRWGQVHHRSAGTDGPVLVLLHESPLSSVAYEAALPHLGSALRAVALDTPGYGMSDGPRSIVEIPDYAATLLEAVDALGIDRFAVAGVHTGASLAVQLAVQAPDRVTHAVLSGVPVWSEEERQQYLMSWSPPMEVDADGAHLDWAWQRYIRIWGGPPELLHLGASTLLANLSAYHLAYQAAFRYDPMPDLPDIRCPVLLYTAADDLLVSSDEIAVGIFPDARLERVEGFVGQLPMRIPEQYAHRVIDFVTGSA